MHLDWQMQADATVKTVHCYDVDTGEILGCVQLDDATKHWHAYGRPYYARTHDKEDVHLGSYISRLHAQEGIHRYLANNNQIHRKDLKISGVVPT